MPSGVGAASGMSVSASVIGSPQQAMATSPVAGRTTTISVAHVVPRSLSPGLVCTLPPLRAERDVILCERSATSLIWHRRGEESAVRRRVTPFPAAETGRWRATVRLEGNSAIVTGGAGGLGEATTRRLAPAGGAAIISHLADDRAKGVAGEPGEGGGYVRTRATQPGDNGAAIAPPPGDRPAPGRGP